MELRTLRCYLAWKKHQIFTRAIQAYLEAVQQVITEYTAKNID